MKACLWGFVVEKACLFLMFYLWQDVDLWKQNKWTRSWMHKRETKRCAGGGGFWNCHKTRVQRVQSRISLYQNAYTEVIGNWWFYDWLVFLAAAALKCWAKTLNLFMVLNNRSSIVVVYVVFSIQIFIKRLTKSGLHDCSHFFKKLEFTYYGLSWTSWLNKNLLLWGCQEEKRISL